MNNPAKRLVSKFGGLSQTARKLGHRHVTTVQGWVERGAIPVKQIPNVLMVAEREGIAFSLQDAIPGTTGATTEGDVVAPVSLADAGTGRVRQSLRSGGL